MTVVVYTRPNCIQCRYTTRELDRLALEYVKVNVDEDDEARDAVVAYGRESGTTQLPVVVTGAGTWTGFSPDKLRALAS